MAANWQVRILGRYSLDKNGKPVMYFGERKEEELLALLLVEGSNPVARDRLGKIMWPDAVLATARKYVSYHLFILKQRLAEAGLPDLVQEAGSRALRLASNVTVDAWEFNKAVAAVVADPQKTDALERALALYGGGLLPDIPFEWLEAHRAEYEERYTLALRVLQEVAQPSALRRELLESVPPSAWPADVRIRRSPRPQEMAADLQRLAVEAEAGLATAERRMWIQRLDEAGPQLDSLFETAVESGQTGPALDVASRLWRYWVLVGRMSAGRQILMELFTNPKAGTPARRARAHHALGMLASYEGDHDSAREHLERELGVWQSAADSAGILSALTGMGMVQHNAGDHAAAAKTYDQALVIARAIDDEPAQMSLLMNRALSALKLSDPTTARALLTERLERLEAHPDVNRKGSTHAHLAAAYLMEGDDSAAAEHAGMALEALAEEDAAGGLAERIHAHQILGRVIQRAGDHAAAVEHFEKALDLAGDSKSLWQAGVAARYLALAVRDLGDGERAGRIAEQARQLLKGAGAFDELRRFEEAWGGGGAPGDAAVG